MAKNAKRGSLDTDEEIEILEEIARNRGNQAAQIAALKLLRDLRPADAKPSASDDPFADLDEADELAPRRKAG